MVTVVPQHAPVPHETHNADSTADNTGDGEGDTTYHRLIALLDAHGARYRAIDHSPEGRTEVVSWHRGNPVAHAAKCLVVMVRTGKRTKRYLLAVVPGDARVDLQGLKSLAGGTYVSFASTDRAEELAGSVSGTVLPFSFHPDLELIVDPALLEHPEIFFNAARLDRSLALDTRDYRDYLCRTGAHVQPITERAD